jgi:hypothetical protein
MPTMNIRALSLPKPILAKAGIREGWEGLTHIRIFSQTQFI